MSPLDNDTSVIAKLYREVSSSLEVAAQSERVLRMSWLQEMETAFGKNVIKSSLLSTLDGARTSAIDAGVAQNTGSALANALDQIRPTQFDAALAAAREIAECESALDALPNYGRGNRPAVDAGTALRISAEKFLDAIDRNMEVFTADQNASGDDVPTSIASIEQSLNDIAQNLGALNKREEANNAS
jgi:hypothetical protein